MHELTVTPTTTKFDNMAVWNDGAYWWSARELMPELGYEDWKNFVACVKRVQSTHDIGVSGTGNTVSSVLITEYALNIPVNQHSNECRPIQDFWLNREACYLVTMECDSRKHQVKLAKDYFVMQTIYAEQVQQTSVPTQAAVQGRTFSMPMSLSEALDQTMLALQGWRETAANLEATQAQLATTTATLESQAPDVSFAQDFKASNFTQNLCLTDVSKHLGVPVRTFFAALRDLGVLWKRSKRDRPAAEYIENGWFASVAQLDSKDVSHLVYTVTPAGVAGIRATLLKSKYARFVTTQTKML